MFKIGLLAWAVLVLVDCLFAPWWMNHGGHRAITWLANTRQLPWWYSLPGGNLLLYWHIKKIPNPPWESETR